MLFRSGPGHESAAVDQGKMGRTAPRTMKEQDKTISEVIAKCWADEDYKQRLLADPMATLKEGGLEIVPGLSIKVVENTDKILYLVIPAKPRGDLSDEDLDEVTGGTRAKRFDPYKDFKFRL
jgi:hypothetical protein